LNAVFYIYERLFNLVSKRIPVCAHLLFVLSQVVLVVYFTQRDSCSFFRLIQGFWSRTVCHFSI